MWRLTIACNVAMQWQTVRCNCGARPCFNAMTRCCNSMANCCNHLGYAMQVRSMQCNAVQCNVASRTRVHCHLPVAAAMPATNAYRPELAHERYRISVPGKQDVINVRVRLQPSTFQYPTPVHEAQQPSQQASVPLGRPRTAKP